MSELNDNNDLSQRAGYLLNRTWGVSPPPELITPILNQLFQAIKESPVREVTYNWVEGDADSWKITVVEDTPQGSPSSSR